MCGSKHNLGRQRPALPTKRTIEEQSVDLTSRRLADLGNTGQRGQPREGIRTHGAGT
jgi:hypothetical protein